MAIINLLTLCVFFALAVVGTDGWEPDYSLEATGRVLCNGSAVPDFKVEAWYVASRSGRWQEFEFTKTNNAGYFNLSGSVFEPEDVRDLPVQLRFEHTCHDLNSEKTNEPRDKKSSVCINVPWKRHMCKRLCVERHIFEAGEINLEKGGNVECVPEEIPK